MEQINDIGFGILCFGNKKYFDGTVKKLNGLMSLGYKCYVLTDNKEFFEKRYYSQLTVINYSKEFKSYHDKILLVKEILKEKEIAIIIDADMNYQVDLKPLKKLKNYNFKDGITYIENLQNHKIQKSKISEMDLALKNDWKMYFAFVNSKIGDFYNYETIWEHFMVFKKHNYDDFYKQYEKLQIIKEYCDVLENKNIVGAGEGITTIISAHSTNTPIQKDLELYELMKEIVVYG
jgi:hypothetical protein